MRHAVYITRAEHWSFESRERVPITEPEWLTYLASDTEFQPAAPARAVPLAGTGPTFVIERPKCWEWLGHPLAPAEMPTFQYLRGGLIVCAPDDHTLRKACAVAQALQARVISDEEEIF